MPLSSFLLHGDIANVFDAAMLIRQSYLSYKYKSGDLAYVVTRLLSLMSDPTLESFGDTKREFWRYKAQ